MSRKYKFHNSTAPYFVSFATVNWINVFTRQVYFDILVDSVNYCRAEKGMELYAYCFMPNHVHFIFRSTKDDPSGLLRDYKKHTAKTLIKAISDNPRESRREWILWMLKRAGVKAASVTTYKFWQHHNQPIELWSEKVIRQKIDYIHKNPVVAGFVTDPINWKYSSARNMADMDAAFELDPVGFL
jgi:REP element-mobilizing transposase RayT